VAQDPWVLAVKERIDSDRRPGATPMAAWKGTTEASQQDRDACSGKNADDALEACTRLINTLSKSDPWLYQAYFYRGKIHWERDDSGDLGPNDLKAAIEANPNAAEVYNYRADQWAKVGWYDSAKEDYLAASRANPTWATPIAGLAETYRLNREYDLALAKITEALRLAPKDPWVLTVKARIDADHTK
jgi:tetratricopeptide (TPR) repeat protein